MHFYSFRLKHVTAVNARGASLSKDEIQKINKFCSTVVEESLQSDVTYDVIKKAIEDSKARALEQRNAHLKRPWSKQLKFENMSFYISREQIPFQRIEPVNFQGQPESSQLKNL